MVIKRIFAKNGILQRKNKKGLGRFSAKDFCKGRLLKEGVVGIRG